MPTPLVVCCSGIFSRARARTCPGPPLRALGVYLTLGIVPADALSGAHRALCDGRTAFQCADRSARLFAMPLDAGRYMWQLSGRPDRTPVPRAAATGVGLVTVTDETWRGLLQNVRRRPRPRWSRGARGCGG